MSDLIDRQRLAEVFAGLVLDAVLDKETKSYSDGLTDAYNLILQLPSAQPDFDTVEKIDKAYDDGYETGYLQGRHDWGDLDE